jgi:hypothetical protein
LKGPPLAATVRGSALSARKLRANPVRIMPKRLLSELVASLLLLLLLSSGALRAAQPDRSPEAEALAVMDAFLVAFNGRDEQAWADTLHFPHVRLASQTVTVYEDRASFLDAMDLDAFAAQNRWRYSTWDDLRVIQADGEKVHVQVRFSRFDADDELIASFDSLYVIERVDGRWGIRARSSFAP